MTISVPWYERIEDGPNGCLLWTGAVTSRGYGCIGRDGKIELVHRVAYRDTVGPIPSGYQVHHRCEQPLCVNPLHLEALSPQAHNRVNRKLLLTADQVREIKRQPDVPRRLLAERYDVSVWAIAEIRKGRNWKDVA